MASDFPNNKRVAYFILPSSSISNRSFSNCGRGMVFASVRFCLSAMSLRMFSTASASRSSIVSPLQTRDEKSGSCSEMMEKYSASSISRRLSPTRIKGTPSKRSALPTGREGTLMTRTRRCFSSYSSSVRTRIWRRL